MVVSQINNDRNQHWESFVLVSLEDVKEVVVFKEAHSSVSNLKVNSSYATHNSFEKLRNEVFNLVDFADFEHFLQLCQKQSLFDAVGEWPELKQAIKQGNGEGSILCEEKHRASQELLVELRAGLHFVQRYNNVLEEYHMLVSQRYSESTDYTG